MNAIDDLVGALRPEELEVPSTSTELARERLALAIEHEKIRGGRRRLPALAGQRGRSRRLFALSIAFGVAASSVAIATATGVFDALIPDSRTVSEQITVAKPGVGPVPLGVLSNGDRVSIEVSDDDTSFCLRTGDGAKLCGGIIPISGVVPGWTCSQSDAAALPQYGVRGLAADDVSEVIVETNEGESSVKPDGNVFEWQGRPGTAPRSLVVVRDGARYDEFTPNASGEC